MLLSSSRTETSKSTNYLRALELAQEAIDWINSAPFKEVTDDNLQLLKGNLVNGKIATGNNAKNSITEPKYPDTYSNAYYYRTIKIEPDTEFNANVRRFLKKVTVEVYWNEGTAPNNLEATNNGVPLRTRKLMLSTIIFNDEAYY
ncbi:MAG: hypothetical protein J6Z11_17155 [Candidatus Riflebacteria bacterium]|nr:hypothetical protein [Candidatus Riflebacteria bacterium]